MEVRMKKKKLSINYKKERAILSDVLPYEIPVIFSNRYFYKFLIEHNINFNSKKLDIKWESKSDTLQDIVMLLFKANTMVSSMHSRPCLNCDKGQKYALKTIPFTFKIAHKNSDYRELSIVHPLNQLHLIEFYDNFKETIKYYSNISRFSIRKPYKVAKFRYRNDYLHKRFKKETVHSKLEVYGDEEEHLKSFFSYNRYSNIHRFFESYQYQRSEKKFQELYKFDIGKCFESIYTHSIAWALYNKELVKDNISSSGNTFAGLFDTFMQNTNYGETNGILIGSEFARIFSELLLQQVDKAVYEELLKDGVFHKKSYELFRYVDDYFVFCDDEKTRDKILNLYKLHLKKYNLHISDSKSRLYKKPIITELTIAKTRITDLLNEQLSIKEIDAQSDTVKKWNVSVKAKNLITRFKIIVSETNIEYKDILNYTIALVERRLIRHIEKFEKEDVKNPYLHGFVSYNLEVLDFVFFVYSVSPRVSATVKIASMLSKMIEYVKYCEDLKYHEKGRIYKKIFDEVQQILDKNRIKKYTQNETLYLLLVLNELGKEYRLDEKFLIDYFINDKKYFLNYFSITTLLFYIKNIARYNILKSNILVHIQKKFDDMNPDNLSKDTELVLLLMDLMSCPYIEMSFKKGLLKKFGITDGMKQEKIVKFQKQWFIKWEDFNLVNELEMKKSQEVYS